MVLSYAKLLLPVIVGTTLLVNIVVYAAVSRIVPIQSILDLIRIHTSGRVFEFHKPRGKSDHGQHSADGVLAVRSVAADLLFYS